MNDIITELFDKCRIIINKLLSSNETPEILYYIDGVFEDSRYISDIFPFVIPLSVIISLTFSILKSRKDGRLKKQVLSGFFIFTGTFIVSEIIWRLLLIPEFLSDNTKVFIFYSSMFAERIFIVNAFILLLVYAFICVYGKIKALYRISGNI